MSRAQRIVLGVGAIAIAAMALFPPWNYVYDFPGDDRYIDRPAYRSERFAGYHALWQANTVTDQTHLASLFFIPTDERSSLQYFSMCLSTTRLGVQLGAALAMTATLTVLLKSNRSRNKSESA